MRKYILLPALVLGVTWVDSIEHGSVEEIHYRPGASSSSHQSMRHDLSRGATFSSESRVLEWWEYPSCPAADPAIHGEENCYTTEESGDQIVPPEVHLFLSPRDGMVKKITVGLLLPSSYADKELRRVVLEKAFYDNFTTPEKVRGLMKDNLTELIYSLIQLGTTFTTVSSYVGIGVKLSIDANKGGTWIVCRAVSWTNS